MTSSHVFSSGAILEMKMINAPNINIVKSTTFVDFDNLAYDFLLQIICKLILRCSLIIFIVSCVIFNRYFFQIINNYYETFYYC